MTSDPTPVIQSTPWYDDGNIIIQAENKQYRVYRGLLAASSPVFKDMFSVASAQAEDLVEGCPVVLVYDSAEDWQYVLQALCERGFVYPQTQPIPLDVISAFLRLGRKYEIKQLYDDGKTRMIYEFMSSLEAFDQADHWSMISPYPSATGAFAPWMIDIAGVLHEIDLLLALPWAYYLVATSWSISTRQILHGASHPSHHSGELCLLPSDVQGTLLIGREAFVKSQFETTWAWLVGPGSDQCVTPSVCATARGRVMEAVFPRQDILCKAIKSWQWVLEYVSEEALEGMCSACTEEAKQTHEAGRKEEWENIPGRFDLPSWEELHKMEARSNI